MKYKYVVADVRLSEVHTARVKVPAWELPILMAVHSNVKVIEELVVDRKPFTAASDEFTRLADRYHGASHDGPPYVASVYGLYGPGVLALENAMKEATVEDEPEALEPSYEDETAFLADTA